MTVGRMGMGPLGMLGVLLLVMLRLLLGWQAKWGGGPSCCSKHTADKYATTDQGRHTSTSETCMHGAQLLNCIKSTGQLMHASIAELKIETCRHLASILSQERSRCTALHQPQLAADTTFVTCSNMQGRLHCDDLIIPGRLCCWEPGMGPGGGNLRCGGMPGGRNPPAM